MTWNDAFTRLWRLWGRSSRIHEGGRFHRGGHNLQLDGVIRGGGGRAFHHSSEVDSLHLHGAHAWLSVCKREKGNFEKNVPNLLDEKFRSEKHKYKILTEKRDKSLQKSLTTKI